MAKSNLRIFSLTDFVAYIRQTIFHRKIRIIQNHHTWKPDYRDFYNPNTTPLQILKNMRDFHINSRGWNDIGQNITIFPDGQVGLCRAIDIAPAGIRGANNGAICIESLGNFDRNGDILNAVQQHAIVTVNAILCSKFNLNPEPNKVVYHHWYDPNGIRFTTDAINSGKVSNEKLQKSCPGTNFLSGNTIDAAKQILYPLIQKEMEVLNKVQNPALPIKQKRVAVNILNVRAGRGIEFPVIRKLLKGLKIQVYETIEGWSLISLNEEAWVSENFLRD